MKTIKVSKRLLDDPDIAKVFNDPIATQLYLQIGSTHIRSQFFTKAILNVAKALNTVDKRHLLTMTAGELDLMLRKYGGSDGAVREPWNTPNTRPGDYWDLEPGSCINWRSYNQDLRNKREAYAKALRERSDRLELLLEALCGCGAWTIEWTEPNDELRKSSTPPIGSV